MINEEIRSRVEDTMDYLMRAIEILHEKIDRNELDESDHEDRELVSKITLAFGNLSHVSLSFLLNDMDARTKELQEYIDEFEKTHN